MMPMPSAPKVSLCMIVKDEAANLPRCLSSVKGLVDEIIVVDTGSQDESKEIAQKFGARVIQAEWHGDFSEARNLSLAQAQGDWILVLDADEEMEKITKEEFINLLATTKAEGLMVTIFNYLGDYKGGNIFTHPNLRLFRNRAAYRFTGKIHEQIVPSILAQGGQIQNTPLRVNHYGYLSIYYLNKNKVNRNLPLLLKEVAEHPEEPFYHFNLGMEYQNMQKYEKAILSYKKAFSLLRDYNAHYVLILIRNLVVVLMQEKRYREALAILKDAKLIFPSYTELVYLEGQCYLNTFCYEEALQAFKDCLNRGEEIIGKAPSLYGTGSYLALEALGDTYHQLGDIKEAFLAYKKAVETNPNYFSPFGKLADLVLPREPMDKALAFLESFVGDKVEGKLILAQKLARYGYSQEAEALLGRCALSPEENRLLFIKAQLLIQLKKYPEALQILESIPSSSDSYGTVLTEKLIVTILNGEPERAAHYLEEGRKAGFKEAYLNFLQIIFNSLHDQKSEFVLTGKQLEGEEKKFLRERLWQVLEWLLSLHEFDAYAKILPLLKTWEDSPAEEARKLAALYRKYDFMESAAGEAMRAIQLGQNEPDLFAILGEVAVRQNLMEEAEVFYRQALELDPRRLAFYTSLIKILVDQKKYGEAEELVRKATRIYPQSDLLRGTLELIENVKRTEKA